MICLLTASMSLAPVALLQADVWPQAEKNAAQAARVVRFASRNSFGWMAHADPASGLLPRNLTRDAFWNAQDCAADNYPFITLTAYMTGNHHLQQAALHILAQEQRLANRLDSLPDDYLFATQAFRTAQPDLNRIIFGAAEYAKDGLIPITEWLGPTPWLERMKGLIADIWEHAPIDTPGGKLPSTIIEVNGDLLQTMGRLYWMTGDARYKEWSFRLADHYLLETSLLDADSLHLRDHGCEIIGGLAEAYVLAVKQDPARRERYRPKLYAVLDSILAHALNEDAQMYVSFNPRTGRANTQVLSDGWGYVYNAFVTVALIDDQPRYLEAPRKALANVHKYTSPQAWARGVDQLADSIEGAINLLNRLPDPSAAAWIDRAMDSLFAVQRPDGILEGWYGDGNSTRTAWMYGLWKTQGITAAPWPEDLQIGAVTGADGSLYVWLKSEWAWSGRLRFDRPRHRDFFRMPLDYPRINQFPEWYTVEAEGRYAVGAEGSREQTVGGKELLAYPLSLKPNEPLKLTIRSASQKAAKSTTR